jgi:hypothetical protein
LGWDDLVYAPADRIGGAGATEFVPGRPQGPSGPARTREQRSPGVTGPSVVPYSRVFRRYADAAGEALERGEIPPGLRDYVRLYFTQLEPQGGPE